MRKSQEIRNRIVVADIFHHLFQKLRFAGYSPFSAVSDLIAENPAEIFVAREGEEAAGVGQRADEGGGVPMLESVASWDSMPYL